MSADISALRPRMSRQGRGLYFPVAAVMTFGAVGTGVILWSL